MTTTLDYLVEERLLCVRYDDTDYNKPERVTLWWPILECHKTEADCYALGAPLRKCFDGRYCYNYGVPVSEAAKRHVFQLTDGGQTLAVKTVVEPIPPPKVRAGIEVRWRWGRWEKYLKTKGWVPA